MAEVELSVEPHPSDCVVVHSLGTGATVVPLGRDTRSLSVMAIKVHQLCLGAVEGYGIVCPLKGSSCCGFRLACIQVGLELPVTTSATSSM